MSDLRHISHALSQYGRNGDTQLVHMSSREVAALDAIGPGLTINPETGLPEAFSLEDIIAPIAGLAAGIFAPWALPYVAGAAGIGTAIGTGDIGKGLMAGLGAYGAGMGGEAISGAMGWGAASAAPGVIGAMGPGATAATVPELGGMAFGLEGPMTAGIGGSIAGGSGLATTGAATAAAAGAPSTALVAANQAAAAAPAAAEGGGIMGFMSRNPWVAPAGMMAMNAMSGVGSGNVPAEVGQKVQGRAPVQGAIANEARMPEGYVYGGPEMSFFNKPISASQALEAYDMNAAQAAPYSLAQASMTGAGGIGSQQQQALQAMQQQQYRGYAEGGPVRGPGDGMSDSVPAMLGDEPVQLANDEFVVPADVVSGLGNGSSEAGHRILMELIANVRAQKGGAPAGQGIMSAA